MLCRRPFVKAGVPYPCGQCMPCRYNRRRLWTHRIMLERLCHADACFVTLTYDDEHLPLRDGKMVLVPKDVQDWLKRLRKEVDPVKIRFYAVGEYGEEKERPHYHVMLFGIGPVVAQGAVERTWRKGLIHVGVVTHDSASYVAGYTVKKMTAKDDPRLRGRTPEFCRMSLRPGIGADAMFDLASELMRYGLDASRVDVPTALAHARRQLPLGRYLRGKLREMIGKDKKVPEEARKAYAAEMLPLYADWRDKTRDASFKKTFAEYVSSLDDQRVLNIETRNMIFKERKSL